MEKTLHIIYYIILIIFTLFLLLVLIEPDWKNKWFSKQTTDIDEAEEEDNVSALDPSEPGSIRHTCPTDYVRPTVPFTVVSQPIESESTITYQRFKELVSDKRFINTYTKALMKSFKDKIKIYTRMSNRLRRDLETAQRKSGGSFGVVSHNTNLERLRKVAVDIDAIGKAIEERLKTLSLKQVERDLKSAIYDRKNGIESLIGRDEVKDLLALQIYSFSRNPKIFFTSFQNIAIYGGSGLGKTKLAETIGHVYARSGILIRRKFRIATQQDFTTAYVNESANLTRNLLMSTLEGVIFIDEAYGITPPKNLLGGSGINHGHEAITELVNFADKHMGLSVIIAAGYEGEMESRFMGANEGMPRRFPHIIRLNNYTSRQLTDILLRFLNSSAPELIVGSYEAGFIYGIVDQLMIAHDNIFDKQAGDMKTISGFLIRSIYGSVSKKWSDSNYENNNSMILSGFNDYLRNRGISINFNFSSIPANNDMETRYDMLLN
jgi:hypothetical protein